MLTNYIKNRGFTQTLSRTNNDSEFKEIQWDADYDGQTANISVSSKNDGDKKHYNLSLDNEDLANMLNVPSINMPLDERLQTDFASPRDERIIRIELPDYDARPRYLSSPLPDEEFVALDPHIFTPHRRNKHKKTHKTYRVYKKRKSPKSTPKSKSPKSTKTKSKTSKRFSLF